MCIDPFRLRGHSHRDHRVSGQVTVDAVCTYAWRRLYFHEHITGEGLQPHLVSRIYLWGSDEPNAFFDIGDTMKLKVQTLAKHASQITEPERVSEYMEAHAKRVGERANLAYAEAFQVIQFVPDLMLVG